MNSTHEQFTVRLPKEVADLICTTAAVNGVSPEVQIAMLARVFTESNKIGEIYTPPVFDDSEYAGLSTP